MKVAVITGASQRLGLYLVESMLKDSYYVIAITRASSKQLKMLNNDQLKIIECDQYNHNSAIKVSIEIKKDFNKIDVLINNASYFSSDNEIADNKLEGHQMLFNTHMVFPTVLIEELTSTLVSSDSSSNIINITDIYAKTPNEGFSFYCATKSGLENLTKSYAKKLAPKTRVNSIQPGPIQFLDNHTEEYKKLVLDETLLNKEIGFGPIYSAVKFLSNNIHTTGTSIVIDGGRSLK